MKRYNLFQEIKTFSYVIIILFLPIWLIALFQEFYLNEKNMIINLVILLPLLPLSIIVLLLILEKIDFNFLIKNIPNDYYDKFLDLF